MIQKSVTILIAHHFHNYWPKWLCFGHIVPNICRFYLTKIQVKRCNSFLTRGKSQNCLILVCGKRNSSNNSVDSAATVAWNLVIFPGAPPFPGFWAISRPLAQFPTLNPCSRKGSHSSKWRCTVKDHEAPCHTRLRFGEILATVCSCTKIMHIASSSNHLLIIKSKNIHSWTIPGKRNVSIERFYANSFTRPTAEWMNLSKCSRLKYFVPVEYKIIFPVCFGDLHSGIS